MSQKINQTIPRKIVLFFVAMWSFTVSIEAQKIFEKTEKLNWRIKEIPQDNVSSGLTSVLFCDDCYLRKDKSKLPYKGYSIELPSDGEILVNIEIINTIDSPIKTENINVGNTIDYEYEIVDYRGSKITQIRVFPYYLNNEQLTLAENYELEVLFRPSTLAQTRGNRNKSNSILADGDIYRLRVDQTGVVKIDKSFLDGMGIVTSNLDPKNIKIYGVRGGLVPELISQERVDDMEELSIEVKGENDGVFNDNDYILFYAEGPNMYKLSSDGDSYDWEQNIYDNYNYYFLKVDDTPGKRVSDSEVINDFDVQYNNFDFYQRYERDATNLLGAYVFTEGTGQRWFGDYFNSVKSVNYGDKFDFQGIQLIEPINVKASFAARGLNNSRVELSVDTEVMSRNVNKIYTSSSENTYARLADFDESVLLTNANPIISISLIENGGNEGWLDYIELRSKNTINLGNRNQWKFSNLDSKNHNRVAFNIQNGGGKTYWDITNPFDIERLTLDSDQLVVSTNQEVVEIMSFGNNSYVDIEFDRKIENQNLHNIDKADLLIVYNSLFEDAVQELAAHRRQNDNLNVVVVDVDQIYNEFSGGRKEPTAIRDFAKMILDRDKSFRYLLLFGDGTYDYKGLVSEIPANNFVPVYETKESLSPIIGFPSDDFFGLLSDDEGDRKLSGALDVSVGRLTVKSVQEAQNVVNKIKHYDTSPSVLGDWRMRSLFVADDEDSSRHLDDSDFICDKTFNSFPVLTPKKVFLDAYIQEATPGGNRIPTATEAINSTIFNGVLVANYLGHGGPKGWAQERVLKVEDIKSWNNIDKLTLLITATCSFSSYDDAEIVTAGEEALLNPDGGAVALLTTTRAVYISENKKLTEAIFDTIYTKEEGSPFRFGEIMRRGKNAFGSGDLTNKRKFTLLGDPSQRLALPKNDIVVTEINGNAISSQDTIGALEKVSFAGKVNSDTGELMEEFNGEVFITLYDKASELKTLGQDPESKIRTFTEYRNILFKGKASVINGRFNFEFVVPKDINYTYGNGRLVLYATNGITDAGGYSHDFVIGGISEKAISDDMGPHIDIFMNDESFVSGGVTTEEPILLLKIKDDTGISISGTSIGHDLTGVLNEDVQSTFVMNDFYEAEIDDASSGTVRYPLSKLEPGRYSISAKVWDVANNSSEARTEFIVLNSDNESLSRVLNYPNPFSTNTDFWFEHDLVGSELEVLVNIYTLSGKVVKTIQKNISNASGRISDINWDGRDDFGNKLGKGVYLYQIKAGSKELGQYRESKFEKIVIL